MSFTAENGQEVTPEMLEEWGQAAERGDYPGKAGDVVIGRPPLSDEELMTVTFKIQPSLMSSFDERAQKIGVSRSELIRRAIARELVA